MLDFKLLENIDSVVKSAERIATALEQSTVAINKLTAMNEKCMNLIGASFSFTEKLLEKNKEQMPEEDYETFKETFGELKSVWEQPGFPEACNTMIKAGI